MAPKAPVVVVGGGVTGLTAAYALGRAGIPTMLIEASDRLGGKVRTEGIDGFLIECGPDSFVSYRPAAIEMARELGLDEALIRPRPPRTVTIRTRGRFVPLPPGMGMVLPTRLGPFLRTTMFTPLEKLRMGLDLLLPRGRGGQDVSVAEFLRRRLGSALVTQLAGPLLSGVYATPLDEMSLLAVVPQLRDAERAHRSLILASLAAGRGSQRDGDGAPFLSLAGGMGQLTDALAVALHRLPGVEIRVSTASMGVERRGGGFAVRLGSGGAVRADALVLAAPGPVTADLLGDIAPEASASIRSIVHGSTAVVSLGYRLEQFVPPPRGHGFLVAGGEPLAVQACTLSSLKWAGRAPDGYVLVRLFLRPQPSTLSGSDDHLVGLATRDLARTMGVRGAPILIHVARSVNQMPRYTVGHLERVDAARAALARLPALAIAGAPFGGVGVPSCIAQGRAAAAQVAAALSGGSPPASLGGDARG